MSTTDNVHPPGADHAGLPGFEPGQASDQKPDYGMPVHPVCALFPMMDRDAKVALGGDIRENGLLHPIVLHEGQIVDGRNRLLVCRAVDVEPRFVEWRDIYKGPMTLARWIWSVNVERRHLTLDQIVAVEVAINAWEEREAARRRQDEARKAQGEHGKEGGRGNKKPLPINRSGRVSDVYAAREIDPGTEPATSEPDQPSTAEPEESTREPRPEGRSGEVRKRLAKKVGASERKIQQALNAQSADPELLKQVVQGATTLRDADKQAKAKRGRQKRRGSAKPKAFNLERAVTRAVRAVEKVLDASPDENRDVLLAELVKTLEAMR